jgi:hypothetical protein
MPHGAPAWRPNGRRRRPVTHDHVWSTGARTQGHPQFHSYRSALPTLHHPLLTRTNSSPVASADSDHCFGHALPVRSACIRSRPPFSHPARPGPKSSDRLPTRRVWEPATGRVPGGFLACRSLRARAPAHAIEPRYRAARLTTKGSRGPDLPALAARTARSRKASRAARS